MRLRLRAPKREDGPGVAGWLPEAVAAVQGRGTAASADTLDGALARWDTSYPAGRTLLAVAVDGTPLGLVRARRAAGARLVVDALTVRADARNLGYGVEMVMAIEAEHGDAVAAFAGVPRTNGLAVYFWLRAGYHPLYPVTDDGGPGLDGDRLWMTRVLI